MGNTFSLIMIVQVENHYQLSDKVKLKAAIVLRPRAQCDGLTDQCLGNLKFFTTEMDNSFLLNFSNDVGRSVLNRRQKFRERPFAYLITTGRNFHIQSFVRSMMVILKAPRVKLFLHFLVSPRKRITQQLGFQSFVKSFVFSTSLRMSRSTIANQNSKTHKPNRQLTKRIVSMISPRRTVVGDHLVRQTILTECLNQARLHRFSAFVQTCLQHHRVTRVIIQNCQRMAAAFRTSNVSFEIHLPKVIRMLSLKSLKRRMFQSFKFINQSIPSQNLGDCAGCRNIANSMVLQKSSDFSTTPRTVLFAHLYDRLFDCCSNAVWTVHRTAGHILQTRFAAILKTLKPFIASFAADTKVFAKPAYVFAISCQINKFFSKINHARLFPGHRCLPPDERHHNPLKSVTYVSERLLPMSPVCTSPFIRGRNCFHAFHCGGAL